MSLFARWNETLDGLKAQGRFRSLRPPRGTDFTSNDYLGYFSRGQRTEDRGQRTEEGSGRSGCSLSSDLCSLTSGLASRLLRGHHPVWDEVEAALAAWHGADSVLVMNSGFTANEGLVSTVVEPGDWVATDELNHACVMEGLRICRPRKFAFRHNDVNHLEEGLKKEHAQRPPGREMFVVTESLFSMDGDRAPLREIVELAEKYAAHVIVDEAHSTGCYGPDDSLRSRRESDACTALRLRGSLAAQASSALQPCCANGSGIVDQLGLRSRVLASVHTGGKALGVTGAYVCGSRLLRDYLVNRCRHLIFTTALPPAIGPWWLDMLPKVRADYAGRTQLHANAARFHSLLRERGIPTLGDSYIVPVVLGDDPRAVQVATRLQERGYDIRAIRPPSVPQGTARLRISIHADHSLELIDQLAEHVAEAIRE